jgi:hypothetical protein
MLRLYDQNRSCIGQMISAKDPGDFAWLLRSWI